MFVSVLKVCEVLEKFSIQAEQILTITIDNAKNLIGTNKTDYEGNIDLSEIFK